MKAFPAFMISIAATLSVAWSIRGMLTTSHLREELERARGRSPCLVIAANMPSLELMIKPRGADPLELRYRVGPLAIAMHSVVGQCTGDPEAGSRLASQLAEAPDYAAAVATLRAMRTLMHAHPPTGAPIRIPTLP